MHFQCTCPGVKSIRSESACGLKLQGKSRSNLRLWTCIRTVLGSGDGKSAYNVTCAPQICFFQLSRRGPQMSVHANEEDLKKEGEGCRKLLPSSSTSWWPPSPSTIPTPQGHLLKMVLASRSWKLSFFPILCQLQDRTALKGLSARWAASHLASLFPLMYNRSLYWISPVWNLWSGLCFLV